MRLVLPGIALLILALSGCESLRTVKADNPVIGPPPPRLANAGRTRHDAVAAADPDDSLESDEEQIQTAGLEDDADSIRPVSRTVNTQLPLEDDFIVAKVNESPIFARELLDAYRPGLIKVTADVEKLKGTPNYSSALQQFREIQLKLIRQVLQNSIERRMIAMAIRAEMKDAQFKQVQEAMEKDYRQFEQEMWKRKEFQVSTSADFQDKLRQMGYDPVQFRQNRYETFLAQTYFSIKGHKPPEADRAQMLEYYNEHLKDYEFPRQVKWQQIQVRGSQNGGKEKARKKIDQAVDELLSGVSFADVATKYSDGLTAKEGGLWDWMKENTLADPELEQKVFDMPLGEVSPVIESQDSYHVVVVLDRKQSGRKPFEEVQPEIARTLGAREKNRMIAEILDELKADTVVWTMFDDEKTPAPQDRPAEVVPF